MMTSTESPATRDRVAFAGLAGGSPSSARVDRSGSNPLDRLVQITRSNDRLLAELKQARRRLDQAVAYMSDPKSRFPLGAALVAHAQRKRIAVLDQLRDNRSEALAILTSGRADR